MATVVPAIIPKSYDDLRRKALLVQDHVETVQVDIMDGEFAPEASYPFTALDRSDLERNLSQEMRLGFELDMMVNNPEQYFGEWMQFGVSTFILHHGSTDKLDELIDYLRVQQKGVALAIRPSTPMEEVEKYISKVDFIQHMGNDKIGFHGVELDESVYERIRHLRSVDENVIISVDIGVNFETAPKLVEAGAIKLVSGSAIYSSENISEAIQKLSLAE